MIDQTGPNGGFWPPAGPNGAEQPATAGRGGNRRRRVATGLAVGLLGGGAAGLIVGTPLFVSAQDAPTTPSTTTSESTTSDAPTTADAAPSTTARAGGKAGDEATDDTTTTAPRSDDKADGSDKEATKDGDRPDWGAKRSDRLRDALKGLVDKGTITQQQADAVIKALEDSARQFRTDHKGGGRGGNLGGMGLERAFGGLRQAYDALGLTPQELAKKLMDGKSLADIAKEQGVATQVLVDSVIDPLRERLDSAVADGRMTRQKADERIARATKAVNDAINRKWDPTGAWNGRGGPHFDMGHHGGGSPDHKTPADRAPADKAPADKAPADKAAKPGD